MMRTPDQHVGGDDAVKFVEVRALPGFVYRRVLYPDGRVAYPHIGGDVRGLIGVSADELASPRGLEDFARYIEPEDRALWKAAVLRSGETLEPFVVEGRLKSPDGTIRWLRSAGRPRRRPSGEIVWDGAVLDITDLKETEFALRESERHFRMLAEALPGILWRADPDGSIIYANRRAREYIGLDDRRGLGWTWTALVHPDDLARTVETWRMAIANGTVHEIEYRLRRHDGAFRWFLTRALPFRNRKRQIIGWFGIMTDIDQQKRVEARLAASVMEKETLLREVHHRVKNNLQVVASLLHLEALGTPSEETRRRFEGLAGRISVMGDIHEKLYAAPDLGRIDMGAHITRLCANIEELYDDRAVSLEIRTEPTPCDIDVAIPVGMIAHELVTNAFKHAFSDGRGGRVSLDLRRLPDGRTRLGIADTGRRRPEPAAGHRLGLRLVNALVGQIGGRLTTDTTDGTRVTVDFAAEP